MAATASQTETPLKIFVSYSHRDEELKQELEKHLSFLKRDGLVTVWTDRRILPGEAWKEQISSNLDSADIVLLLVSADFAASDYCWDLEMVRAVELHSLGSVIVIPIILRPVDGWKSSPISRFQALPTDGRPITTYEDRDRAFEDVVRGIRTSIITRKLHSQPKDLVDWYLDVDGTLHDYTPTRNREIASYLRKLMGELDIHYKGVQSGSVRLNFSSTRSTYQKLANLHPRTNILEALGVRVLGLYESYGATVSIISRVLSENADLKSTPTPSLSSSSVIEPFPPLVTGMVIGGGNPFNLGFNLGVHPDSTLTQAEIAELQGLLGRYLNTFMVIPGEDMHVNLSPFEEGCGIPVRLRETELGLALLKQDLNLKKFTAALLHPATATGKSFWSELKHANADTADLASCIRVWIVPGSCSIKEGMVGNDGVVTIEKMSLDVLSDHDHETLNYLGLPTANKAKQEFALSVFRKTILPTIEQEVRIGSTFGPLRQILSVMVLSAWMKKWAGEHLKKIGYMDSGDTAKFGLNRISDEPIPIQKEYQQLVREGSWRWIETTEKNGKLERRLFIAGSIDLGRSPVNRRRGGDGQAHTSRNSCVDC